MSIKDKEQVKDVSRQSEQAKKLALMKSKSLKPKEIKKLKQQELSNIDLLLKTEKLQNCELIIIGMVGLRPSMKEEVPFTILKAKEAGVQIRMITGDSRETALDLAKQGGLIQLDGIDDPFVCMTG